MSYSTRFSLEVTPFSSTVIPELRNLCEGAEYALADDGSSEDRSSWYDHESDLREFSVRHPELLFKLSGNGEENADIWDKYFQNGRMQECKAVIMKSPFDPNKLK